MIILRMEPMTRWQRLRCRVRDHRPVLRRCAYRDGWVWFNRCWHTGYHRKNGRHFSW